MFKSLVLALAATLVAAAPAPITWEADLAHCRAEFTVSHMVPAHIDAVLDVSAEDTDNHDRDADLRSATYFDVAKYPYMTFHSTSMSPKMPPILR